MKSTIRPYTPADLEPILELSILAWEPVFQSFENILGPQIYPILYPDWQKSQREGVAEICKDTDKYTTLVADSEGVVVGFLSYILKEEVQTGEVYLLAVHPDYQNQEIGTDLNLAGLQVMKEAGMKLAVVGTGGDEGHAPARRSYEKAGYTPLPLVRYYKDL
jgi:ribosomal protein S18 acetylase RimI-like enzyme